MRTLLIADIHGSLKALKQVFERSKFDYKKDKLICLGDTADGWTETFECFEELFKIKNLIYIRGNHDQWLKDWLKEGKEPNVWTFQGGLNTIHSYDKATEADKKRHLDFLKKSIFYYIDEETRCFVHGGIKPNEGPKDTDKMYLMWDRELVKQPFQEELKKYKEIYIGHTSIWRTGEIETPLNLGNVWMMDTGGGWEGRLSIIDINSKKVWQSDIVAELYGFREGRI